MTVVPKKKLNFDYEFSKLNSFSTGLNNKSILIIDDNSLILKNLTLMLTKNGFTVYGASTEFESLELFYSHTDIKLVILDYFSSEINGLELFSIYKTLNPGLRILMLIDDDINIKFWENLDIEAFIAKPILLDYLVLVLEETLLLQ